MKNSIGRKQRDQALLSFFTCILFVTTHGRLGIFNSNLTLFSDSLSDTGNLAFELSVTFPPPFYQNQLTDPEHKFS